MNKREFSKCILRSNNYLKTASADNHISNPSSFNPSEDFKKICLGNTSTYEEIYLMGLKLVEYNILLSDYSFLQFNFQESGSRRYAYYPNPFLGAPSEKLGEVREMKEYLDEGLLDMEQYLHSISEIRSTLHPPLFRYEHSPNQYEELCHPCSHFHVGHHADNRWPVQRVLTPEAFSLMILKHFYKSLWENAGHVTLGKKKFSLDEVYSKEKSKCRKLPQSLFSSKEHEQFFWG